MAGSSGGLTAKLNPLVSSATTTIRRLHQRSKKLEEDYRKLLSLDPHFYHLNHYLHQNNNGEDEEDQDSSLSPSHKDPALHFHLQYLQQSHSYAGLDTELNNSLHPPKKRSYLLPPSPPPPPSSCFSVEYATKMGETANRHHRPATASSRLAVRGGVGEIVEVQGGHIVRSTGRKDRHSKVCTAKGTRDRRVRLSAHTAIQFYDVQDRLGYDRPSKAVDWLIKNAKAAIDELAKLPAWSPNTTKQNSQQEKDRRQDRQENENESPIGVQRPGVDAVASGGGRTSTAADSGGRIMEQLDENPNCGRLDFLPPTFDTNIADSIKSFFPIEVSAPETNSSSVQFQNYSPDLLSRTSSACQNQDLRLSLQSLQDPILLHQPQPQTQHHQNEQLFSATTPLGFDGASFPEEHDRFHRMVAWNVDAADAGNNGHGGGGGFIFNSPSPMPTLPPPLFGQSQYLSQRGPLQSSNTPLIRAWIDSSVTATPDHLHHYLPPTIHHQSSISGGIGFDSGIFSGFRIPARIQGEEEYDGISDKPSSASSDSRH